MIPKQLKEIKKEDLLTLRETKIPEGKTIDYKSQLSISSDEEKKDFYKDITSFTNAEGGDIIYGIIEENRIPKELVGVEVENIDEMLLKLSNMIRSGVEPTIIPQPEFQPIRLEENKYVIIIRVHKSFTAPHRISFNAYHKFFIRGDGDNNEMSVSELRNTFIFSQSITERIQNFRLERLHKLVSDNTPVPLTKRQRGKMMLHLIPLQSFTENTMLDVNSDEISEILKSKLFEPIESHGDFSRYNLEGFVRYGNIDTTGGTYSYVQFFRNGVIEAVFGACLEEKDGSFVYGYIKNKVLEYGYNYLELMKKLNIIPPIYALLTFYDIKGSTLNLGKVWGPNFMGSENFKFEKELISLPEVVINDFVSNENELESIFKPVFDVLMNAFGLKAK
jgi:hypothetical protein